MADHIEDAQLAAIGNAAYALASLAGAPPPKVPGLASQWIIRGYLSADDELFRAGRPIGARLYYGFIAESAAAPGNFVVAIRGTANPIEWAEDAEFMLRAYPGGGHVEAGFYDLYASMLLEGAPLVAGIAAMVGTGTVTVVGHSLGAAIATYLTLDLAALPGMRVRGRFYASPHPGDEEFARRFDIAVADYAMYAYELDAVPRLPLGLGYCHVAKTTWITPKTAEAVIKFDLSCHHSLMSYCAMIYYGLRDWTTYACIKGPRPAAQLAAH